MQKNAWSLVYSIEVVLFSPYILFLFSGLWYWSSCDPHKRLPLCTITWGYMPSCWFHLQYDRFFFPHNIFSHVFKYFLVYTYFIYRPALLHELAISAFCFYPFCWRIIFISCRLCAMGTSFLLCVKLYMDINVPFSFAGNVSRGRTTYVHCKAGRGRSTTIVLCYLVASLLNIKLLIPKPFIASVS